MSQLISAQRPKLFIGQSRQVCKYLLATVLKSFSVVVRKVAGHECGVILLESYNGEQLSCSPRAIYEYMRVKYPGKFRYVWAVKRGVSTDAIAFRDDSEVCRYRSVKHFLHACRASVLICNAARGAILPSPAEQVAINTWHGTSYKNLGVASNSATWLDKKMYEEGMRRWDYFLSGSSLFSEVVVRRQLMFRGEILLWGTPRNDVLYAHSEESVRHSRMKLGITDNQYLVVYAPTWRDNGKVGELFDVKSVRVAFERRFGKKVIMGVRAHHRESARMGGSFDLDLSEVEDVRDILLAADALISDYSSIIWDYSLLSRPFFLYAPDIDSYADYRGFIVEPRKWGFPISTDSDALERTILSFNAEEHESAITYHHELYGMYEDGCATERVANLVAHIISGQEKGYD